jgi:ABC-type proline/glycine betaine transport system permease subunit
MAEKPTKVTFKDLIKMETKEVCEAAIKNGWIAALISMGLTLIFSSIGFFTQSDNEELNHFLNPWMMVDVVLIAIMAFFIHKKSRTAATLIFLYFITSKFLDWYALGSTQGLPLALVFIFYYFNAMRGNFMWHSNYKNQDIEPSPETKI